MAGYNNFIGYNYPNTMNYPYTTMNNASYTQPMQQPQQQKMGIEWVDGEVGAKAFQLPAGWPPNVPMPLWDTNDTIIYLKSVNQMGMPNPIQKVHYTMDQSAQQSQTMVLPAGEGQSNTPSYAPDMSNYVTKDDMKQMVEELKAAINTVKEVKWNGKSSV